MNKQKTSLCSLVGLLGRRKDELTDAKIRAGSAEQAWETTMVPLAEEGWETTMVALAEEG